MTPDRADSLAQAAAAYVHIPFCSAVCPYCDFAVVAGRDDLAERYVEAVCTEIARSSTWRPLDAVYLGGGTPSHVDPGLLGRVVEALASRHGIAERAEVTLEANPEDLTLGRAEAWVRLGFNRVSFGAQSFNRVVLESLGRRHLPADIAAAVEESRRAGFDNLSLDLIYGTPGETAESWRETLGEVVSLAPDHLSCYALTVEPGTTLHREVAAGAPAPDPDVQADRFEAADAALRAAGYGRYEVSNWSRPGRECVYNSIVWAQGEYQAYGNGAHGHRDGRRFRNLRRLDSYLEAVEGGRSPRAGEESVEGWAAEIDRLFVGLRREVGVLGGPGVAALLAAPEGRRLVEAGVVEERDGRLRVTRPLLSDQVQRALLDLAEPSEGWAEAPGADIVSERGNV